MMTDFQQEKALVRAFHEELDRSNEVNVAEVLARYVTTDWHWRGMHPFHEQFGPEAVAESFWGPLLNAFTRIQRRPDIFIAGLNEIDGFKGRWVVEMGHLMGLFDRPWLGIQPTKRIAMLRFVEFNRIEDGRIAETAMFCDVLHLMMQAGQNPLPPQTGAMLVQPGPMTHTGLCYSRQDPAVGKTTLAAINALLQNPKAKDVGIDEATRLSRVWHDDMIWWGPGGIGATYTIERYLRQHSTPFGAALTKDYRFNGHLCRLAEGHFGGFFGWANLTVTNAGGYLGMTAGPGPSEMRVVDMYRVQDGKLAENWIFIDILHYLAKQGLDVLGRMEAIHDGGG
jgi:hypothetical protein